MENLNKELKNCNTLKEIIATMDKYYNLDQPLGVMSKATVLSGLDSVIKITQIKKRENGL